MTTAATELHGYPLLDPFEVGHAITKATRRERADASLAASFPAREATEKEIGSRGVSEEIVPIMFGGGKVDGRKTMLRGAVFIEGGATKALMRSILGLGERNAATLKVSIERTSIPYLR